jgi:hypothetical protein
MQCFVASVSVALALAGLAAKAPDQAPLDDARLDQAPLDRIVERLPSGGPFVWTPATGSAITAQVRSLAIAAGVSIGFEAVLSERFQPTQEELEAARGRELRTLAGETVREALDLIVRIDPRYRWIDMDGVPVVRPVEAWADRDNLLHRPTGRVDWQEVDLGEALHRFKVELYGREFGTLLPRRGPTFAVHFRGGSYLGLLNQIARSHGGFVWAVHYRCGSEARLEPLQLFFWEFDGGLLSGGQGSCIPNRPSGV